MRKWSNQQFDNFEKKRSCYKKNKKYLFYLNSDNYIVFKSVKTKKIELKTIKIL